MRKNDPFWSLRAALEKGVSIECRLDWHPKRYLHNSTVHPFYYWKRDDYDSGTSLYHQLKLADAMGWLAWQTTEEYTPLDRSLFFQNHPEQAEPLPLWRKRLLSLDIPEIPAVVLPRPFLGTWFDVTATAYRRKYWKRDEHGDNDFTQEIAVWEANALKEPLKAIYTGFRTVYEGQIVGGSGSDNPGVFHVARSVEMWKFVSHPRQNSFYVFPHHAMLIQDASR